MPGFEFEAPFGLFYASPVRVAMLVVMILGLVAGWLLVAWWRSLCSVDINMYFWCSFGQSNFKLNLFS